MTATHAIPSPPATPGIASTAKFHDIGRASPALQVGDRVRFVVGRASARRRRWELHRHP